MRICEPFLNKVEGLWLFILEPQTWVKLQIEFQGQFCGLYCNEKGSILGNGRITKPDNFTWKQYLEYLLNSMPQKLQIIIGIRFYI